MAANAKQVLFASEPDISAEKSTLEFQPDTEHFALVKWVASMTPQSRNASSTDDPAIAIFGVSIARTNRNLKPKVSIPRSTFANTSEL